MTAGPALSAPRRDGFDTAYTQVRGESDIQFAPSFAKPPDPPPEWWSDVTRWLSEVLGPLAQALSASWPVLSKLLLGALVVGVAALLWVILAPYIADWRERRAVATADWAPDRAQARKLLEEADALAAQERFDEAAHLLLYRSIEDIAVKRPELLRPSTTAREIGAFEALSARARSAFSVIAGHVEASFFARRPLDRQAWDSSREAYRAFALDGG
ncbi:hypothetical protein [Blastomonas aquatica]|uniref:DUF4129 domain-containing protein n=1 Tax=Blastomonas aquatica TaxID=1510276 RepID=A0ABQ1JCK7_9SPHN|nr:hypothetical protein [Blastomonas aquatica]GGB65402.1 hypothetical protein GCM10010833_20750 [Blastomonas aquatica]